MRALAPAERGVRLRVEAPALAGGLAVGDSIAVNGACLTAVELEPGGFAADVVAETLRRTTLGTLSPGDGVNLEGALRAGAPLGGHVVQGHVDAVGEVRGAEAEGESVVLEIGTPSGGTDDAGLRYVVEKGSVAVDGVSLTVAARLSDGFRVALIPHTMAVTTLGRDARGRRVNLEWDVLAKYVEALVAPYHPAGGQ